ncbi:MAG: AMP-binding protein [Proteobacteria bacterium]|nr:AMP-binding protein [Pseudomonadota bacterium]
MDRIWLKSYPEGVPAEVDLNQLPTLARLIDDSCSRYADSVAYVQMGRSLKFSEIDRLAGNFAAYLQKTARLAKGERIAIMLPNVLQYPIAMFAALRSGLIVVNTNPLYTPPELEHQLIDSGATAILVLENFAHVVQKVLPKTQVKHVFVTAVGDLLGFPKSAIVNYVIRKRRKQVPEWHIDGAVSFTTALAQGAHSTVDKVDVRPEDVAFLQYTGGTTGVAKGAMLTHTNVTANILQAEAWITPVFHREPGTLITPIPLYHIFALTANCLLFLRLGWRNILIINPRDFPAVIKELKKYPFSFISGVNTLFNALLNQPDFATVDFSHLKITLGGGMAVQASVAKRWKEVTGKLLTQAWGLTETSPAACINPPLEDFNGAIGLPISSTDIAIRDDAGNDLPVGEIGEICVHGPQVTLGYWNRPDETAKVMLPGNWLRTGDIGRMDERGYVYIEDRKKDMILVSGFNVYPNEVEAVAAAHPGILEVAAVAQPDEHSGEVVALFVVRKDPSLTERAVIDFCRQSLAAYKTPRHVYFRNELPKTNVGKILRKALREEVGGGQGGR